VTEDVEPITETIAGRPKQPPQHRSFLKELPVLVIIALVLALLIKHFFVQAFYIPSGSMMNTLQVGDRVLVNKVPYYYRDPHRGEIVVFNGLDSFSDNITIAPASNPISKALRKISSTIGLGAPDEKDFIKRVIGLPGDRVMCCDPAGQVVVTPRGGSPVSLKEPYIFEQSQGDARYFCEASQASQNGSLRVCPPGSLGVLVPSGRLWVMGDHRNDSADSRFHITDANHGTVPINKVVGRAFTVVYPFGRAGLLGVPSTFKPLALPAVPYGIGLLGALPVVAVRRRLRHR
jgi:signal peptidase I